MLLGIDVGGTFTDAVLIEEAKILALGKCTTTHGAVLHGILAALDRVLAGYDPELIERVVISSTIVTNALTEKKTDPVYLAVMPGPGMNVEQSFPVPPQILKGYVDHRGKVITVPDVTRLRKQSDIAAAAISGKFSVRNRQNEQLGAQALRELGYQYVFQGSGLSGELNFVRRTNSAYFAAAVARIFQEFCSQVKISLAQRQISAPVQILKADGGTLPLEEAALMPEESIFTGPAASVLGILALTPPAQDSISLDVGGTTTDIAFWEHGKPLLARHGARIGNYNTAVRAFHMRSVGIGGDSMIRRDKGVFKVGPERSGPSMAVGGTAPALADALVVLGKVNYGDRQHAEKAMQRFVQGEETVFDVARQIVNAALAVIEQAIQEMLYQWSIQPVYTVNDVLKGTAFHPQALIGVGGGAPGLINLLGERLHLPVYVPRGAMVANAVGAALARPTLRASLRADTTEGYYLIPESGHRQNLPQGFDRQSAHELLEQWLNKECDRLCLPHQHCEVIAEENFHTIHASRETGEIIYVEMQMEPGIFCRVQGEEAAL